MTCLEEKGFTLVELMVVIAIIGILATTLIIQGPRIREMGRSTHCKANLKNLAMAAQSWSLKEHDNGRSYPAAGSWESKSVAYDRGRDKYVDVYWSGPGNQPDGWVSWTMGATGRWPWREPNGGQSSHAGQMTASRFNDVMGYISITNGALWEYVGKDLSVYVCKSHQSAVEKKAPGKKPVYRSYVMNKYFGYVHEAGRRNVDDVNIGGTASLRLMFAEMPGLEEQGQKMDLTDQCTDSVLEYEAKDGRKQESIGFNHRVARGLAGHVVFVDGHVETLFMPSTPQYVLDLTVALCRAEEVDEKIRKEMR